MRYIPNVLSSLRILMGACLWFAKPFGKLFYALYSLCGATDLIDGPLARKYNCTSQMGAALDTVGDAVFCLTVITLIILNFFVPGPLILIAAVMAVIKIAIFAYRTAHHGNQEKSHNVVNRMLGGTLFILGYFVPKILKRKE